MARNKGWMWTVIISLLVGVVGATFFWLYSPYGHDQLAQQVAEDLQAQRPPVEVKGSSLNLSRLPSQAVGPRFQMVADGKQVFLVDLQNGRVWRYFHQTKAEGFSQEDEGFLPMAMYYAGKKHYSAAEIEPPPGSPGNPPPPAPEGKPSP
jgi:hypothetical protein